MRQLPVKHRRHANIWVDHQIAVAEITVQQHRGDRVRRVRLQVLEGEFKDRPLRP